METEDAGEVAFCAHDGNWGPEPNVVSCVAFLGRRNYTTAGWSRLESRYVILAPRLDLRHVKSSLGARNILAAVSC